ncbi:hypothetical protein [Sedimenticola selenatireducens]|uniref:Uncharacterized protein n=1 Tax=Sedimenticola selenatireducens TaxID=191960 RepID=A0A558DQQ8_9GAMM|nr:hypothetical protein [Sedimenticola selenatireducens]TVO73423.1 hypothetical protein FHP88_11075 [Sedimenticola selenatireducens]TVT63364.1 MAG: hypothetical protein FHK78_11005 [Sedimenticola selenatireducens]
MNKNIGSLLLSCLLFLPAWVSADVPTDWKQITHGGLTFSMPADWVPIKERDFEGQWGIKDDEKRQAVVFSIARERHPERMLKGAEKDGMTVQSQGVIAVGALSGEQHQISGSMKDQDLFLKLVILDGLLPKGDKITFNASIVSMPVDQWQPVIEQVMASVVPTSELEALLQGYSQHKLFDGLITLDVRNNWDMTDHTDNVSWEPPLVSIYGAQMIRFAHGYNLTGSNGLLSKMKDPVIEKSEMYGIPAWKIVGTGVGVTYTTPMRTKTIPATTVLYLSDICLAKGDRFGYAITASDEMLVEHKAELDKLLSSVKLTLPEEAGPCDDLVTYEWNEGLKIGVPRSWRKNQDSKFQISWYDRALTTGADIRVSINHHTTDVHPITGYDHPAETLEQLTIDGYPATHYRKTHTGSDKIEKIYDYYIIDSRMRFKAATQQNTPSFFIVQFTTSPSAVAQPDIATHQRVLDSIVFGPEWESETLVKREAQSVTNIQGVDDPQTGPLGKAVDVTETVKNSEPTTEEAAVDAPAADPIQAEDAADETPVNPPIDEPKTEKPAAPSEAVAIQDDARQRYEQAKALREAGALLQKQGKLVEAVEKYRSSLSFYPDDKLEEHVRRIEQMLGNGGR